MSWNDMSRHAMPPKCFFPHSLIHATIQKHITKLLLKLKM